MYHNRKNRITDNIYILKCLFFEFLYKRGEFNNLTQQMINFIFVELWKNYTDD